MLAPSACCPLCGTPVNAQGRPVNAWSASQGLIDRLEELLTLHLPTGGLHSHVAARKLGLSTRSLARNLKNEGTTFVETVQRLRMRLAQEYLRDERMPLADIAWKLGFDAQSSFSHACRKWFGKSPLELRMFLLVEAQK